MIMAVLMRTFRFELMEDGNIMIQKHYMDIDGIRDGNFYIKVIDFFDIPDEDNCQSVYIPLLGSKEYLER